MRKKLPPPSLVGYQHARAKVESRGLFVRFVALVAALMFVLFQILEAGR